MLPTFETLINFPVVVKQKGETSTDFIRIHSNATFEIISLMDEDNCRLGAYGIDGTKDVDQINEILETSVYSTPEEFENQLRHLKQFIPGEN